MNRIQTCFEQLKQKKQKGLIPYITAGHHPPAETLQLLHTLVKSGADLLELGVPFSDPVADGPVIEKAHQKAVARHVTLADVLDIVTEFRKQDENTPVVLMSYLNPIEVMGYTDFAIRASKAGVDGVLIVDCPPEESSILHTALDAKQIDIIYLVSPNTDDQRIKKICTLARGYIYYVSLKGVTGDSDKLAIDEVKKRINHIKTFTQLPVCVGFGVKDGKTASALAATADAVIVGTALVKTLDAHSSSTMYTAIESQMSELHSAIDA
ncbi:MAG: tryptophan synthase subunit alpha [Endozoicomonadaceae bacterium]|nr:tryptophan synthase subunit alpha [Endozoicomonadaceae bacterium]